MESNSVKLIALVNSVLKKEPKQSTELLASQLVNVAKGRTFNVVSWEKATGNHIKAQLSHGAGTWYFYDPHFYFPPTDDKPQVYVNSHGKTKKLSHEDLNAAAKILGVNVPTIKAVIAVESAGGGFLKNGMPKILYEAHIFGKLTNYRFNKTHPYLSSYNWNRKLYSLGGTSWNKIHAAMKLDERAAIQSASYGLFQIMGFHWKTCGYSKPQEFFDAQFSSEFVHLRCFIAFIKAKRLDHHLRSRNWAKFAYGYNGEGYRLNRYDTKLAQAYSRFS